MCLKCKVEEREIDCLSCQELAALNEKLDVEKNATCITEAEEFKTFCLNKVVLQNVLVGLHDARGDYLQEKTSNRSYNFASYKQFTWWVYKSLGKGNRRVIPFCVLWSIQNLFPEPDNKYALLSEAVIHRCSVKRVFLEISQKPQENTCGRVFFNKVAGLSLQLY